MGSAVRSKERTGNRMKILYTALARAVWLFDINLLNPKGLSMDEVIQKTAQRYKFNEAPKGPLDLDEQKGWNFKAGTFATSKGAQLNVDFRVYSDGFVADTWSSTDDSTEFLNDVGKFVTGFGMAIPQTLKKGFLSQLNVETSVILANLNPNLKAFVKRTGERLHATDPKKIESLMPPDSVFGRMTFRNRRLPACLNSSENMGFHSPHSNISLKLRFKHESTSSGSLNWSNF